MTEETLMKAVELEKKLYELKRAKENAENALDFDEIVLNLRRAGLTMKKLDLSTVRNEAVESIAQKLNAALKELEEL